MTTTEIDELGRAAEARMERMDRVAVLYAEITAASHEFLVVAGVDRDARHLSEDPSVPGTVGQKGSTS